MLYVIKFIYGFLLPPGIFILILFVAGIWFFFRQKKGTGSFLLIVSLGLYLFSAEITGELLLHSLEKMYQPPKSIKGDVIVVLGGGATGDTADIDGAGQLSGHSANRILTAARMYKKTRLPIIISGGSVFKDSGNEAEIAKRQLVSLGIPREKILLDRKSLNTEQNAIYTKKILTASHFKYPIVVTSAFHMKRSVLHFEKQGVSVQPYPTDYRTSKKIAVYGNQFVPSGLENTRIALKEYLGILALKAR
ncbi:YdcF family protein [Neobacillus sp. SM06]|uniref:YdcF family protein n=1 Tax=Neobacillus sp. SM06 TaxID=3422492 RepID=UPI003D2E2DFF